MQAKATSIRLINPMLAPQIMSFLKGLAGLRIIAPAQAPNSLPTVNILPKTGETACNNDFFFCPYQYSAMIGNKHDMLTKFRNLRL